jgi:hypothetical protein
LPVAHDGAPPSYPKLIIEDPKELKYEQIHTCLYGSKFKYHSLPGGKKALYDMDIDPGEKNDLSQKYPDITSEMSSVCRDEWDKLIESGRGFWMPATLIGDPRYAAMKRCWAHLPPNVVPCNTAQKVSGSVKCPFEGLRGFKIKNDTAVFDIDVRSAGRYRIGMTGGELAECGPLVLRIAGRELTAKNITDSSIEFGEINLRAKTMPLEIVATANGQSDAFIKEISITPVRKAN